MGFGQEPIASEWKNLNTNLDELFVTEPLKRGC